eukprot:1043226-Pyramimonas_sp.AAC.1
MGMMACALTRTLNGDRLGFAVNIMLIPAGQEEQRATRARARGAARGVHCMVHNGEVAMLAKKQKWNLSGDRLDFEVNM